MSIVITVLHVVACIFLIVVVLLQTGKGADIGAVFGGSSQTIFGSSGAGNLLTAPHDVDGSAVSCSRRCSSPGTRRGHLTASVVDAIPTEPPPIAAPAPLTEPGAPALPPAAPAAQPEGATGDAGAPNGSGSTGYRRGRRGEARGGREGRAGRLDGRAAVDRRCCQGERCWRGGQACTAGGAAGCGSARGEGRARRGAGP
jgi:preprotein translocase subunit SecG